MQKLENMSLQIISLITASNIIIFLVHVFQINSYCIKYLQVLKYKIIASHITHVHISSICKHLICLTAPERSILMSWSGRGFLLFIKGPEEKFHLDL